MHRLHGNIKRSDNTAPFALMTAPSKHSPKADIVAMPSGRRLSPGKSVALRSRRYAFGGGSTATLFSMREHLGVKASVGINDLDSIKEHYSPQVAEKLMATVRGLLDREFGHLRVYRRHQAFVVRHHSIESLIAGLLTVQFHSCQIPLQVTRNGEGMSDVCGVPLSWGVGRSQAEAEGERIRKRTV